MPSDPKFNEGDKVYMRHKWRLGQVWTGKVLAVKRGWLGWKYLLKWTVRDTDYGGEWDTTGWRGEGNLL